MSDPAGWKQRAGTITISSGELRDGGHAVWRVEAGVVHAPDLVGLMKERMAQAEASMVEEMNRLMFDDEPSWRANPGRIGRLFVVDPTQRRGEREE